MRRNLQWEESAYSQLPTFHSTLRNVRDITRMLEPSGRKTGKRKEDAQRQLCSRFQVLNKHLCVLLESELFRNRANTDKKGH